MSFHRGESDQIPDGLFARAQGGDQAAWREIFEKCYPKVVRVARRRLDGRGNSRAIRSLFDSTDIASDVWKSLAAKSDRFDFPSIDQLMAFLVKAAEQKVIDQSRKLTAEKRSEDRKRPLGEGGLGHEPSASGPTPSQFAVEVETVAQIEAGLSAEVRELVKLKREGKTNQEAATQLGWDIRKVQRVLKDLFDSHRAALGFDR